MPRRKQTTPRNVQFLDENEMGHLLSPLTAKAYDIIYEAMDRYIDLIMKQYIQDKVNGKEADETIHNQIKGILNFKQFLLTYKEKKKN